MFYNFIWFALVPRRNGSDNMDMMLQITDYVTDDPNTSTLTGSVRGNEVKIFARMKGNSC